MKGRLEKCKECDIYPSYFLHTQISVNEENTKIISAEYLDIFKCPICGREAHQRMMGTVNSFEIARNLWNLKNENKE